MATLSTYSPNDVMVTLGGIPISGFEEGSFITIAKAENNWSFKGGINGDGLRILKKHNLFTVEFTLMFSSSSNTYLGALALADYQLPGAGLVPISIKNGSGTDSFASPQAWIVKPADTTYSDVGDPKVWNIEAYLPEGVTYLVGQT